MTTNVKTGESAQSWDNLKNIKTHTRQAAIRLSDDITLARTQVSEIERLLNEKRKVFLAKEAELQATLLETEEVGQVDDSTPVADVKNEINAVKEVKEEPQPPIQSVAKVEELKETEKKPTSSSQKKIENRIDNKVESKVKVEPVKVAQPPKSAPADPNAPRTYVDEKGNVKVRKFLVPHTPTPPQRTTIQGQRTDRERPDRGQRFDNRRPQGQVQDRTGRPPRSMNTMGNFAKDKDAPATPRPTLGKKPTMSAPPIINKEGKTYGNKNKSHEKPEDKKTSKKNLLTRTFSGMGDDERVRTRPRSVKRQDSAPVVIKKIEKAVVNTTNVPIKVLSERIGKTVAEIIKELLKEGIFKTINDSVEYEYAAYVANALGVELELKIEKTAEDIITEIDRDDELPDDTKRPPIVTVMGHVDHGKTSLLDAIRSTNVTSSEAGGITQHIGAYTVSINGEQITFIDTPGHAAFTKMRARGAKVTDVAVIVVAADDGVMPQTIEAISHAKAAEVSIIVAINKMDKNEANPDRVKQQLTEYGLLAEDWGGDTIMVPVSAKSQNGIEDLLESILLITELKGLKANPNKQATGTVIEAELNKDKGPVATILVRNGTLHVGDSIIAGTATGKIKAMFDDKGKKIKSAPPSCPVSVLGFSDVPVAGDFMYVADEKLVRKVADERKSKAKEENLQNKPSMSLGDLFGKISEGKLKTLNLIIKTDVQGSLDAVKLSLTKISNDEVRINPIHGGVGGINETDVMLAKASDAIIIGFNVRADNNAKVHAEKEGVDIRLYSVIYDAVDDITKAMKGMLAPKFKEVALGTVTVRETFKISGVGTVAGCYVNSGKVIRNSKVRLYRNNISVHEGAISALKRFKDDAKEVLQGFECGILLENFNDIKVDDVMEVYSMEQVEA